MRCVLASILGCAFLVESPSRDLESAWAKKMRFVRPDPTCCAEGAYTVAAHLGQCCASVIFRKSKRDSQLRAATGFSPLQWVEISLYCQKT